MNNTEYGHIKEDKEYASERNIEVSWVVSFFPVKLCFTKKMNSFFQAWDQLWLTDWLAVTAIIFDISYHQGSCCCPGKCRKALRNYGIESRKCPQIINNFHCYFKVLVSWRNKSSPTVKDLIEMIETAQQRYGYLDSRVWETLRKLVSPDLLPSTASFTDSTETGDSPPEKGQVLNIMPVNLFYLLTIYQNDN